MDADIVRLILLVVGALLILGLYLWERSRGPEADETGEDYGDDDMPYGTGQARRDPQFGRLPAADAGGSDWEEGGHRTARGSPRVQSDEAFREESGADERVPAPLLIQLSVAKRRGEFDGEELMDVATSCGLRPGDMDIFHCLDEFDDGTRVYFSMANMVKPGTFPFDAMEDFSTPGMMLFAQLDGQPEDLTILEEMIATARKLANTLGGDVLDETRRPLTVRKEEDLRRAVLENEARFLRALRH